jgi:hypothetical protein
MVDISRIFNNLPGEAAMLRHPSKPLRGYRVQSRSESSDIDGGFGRGYSGCLTSFHLPSGSAACDLQALPHRLTVAPEKRRATLYGEF